ncbi:helix-turn-helix domain-containing protein [Caenimonas sedimenti]|uniref:Helix-turn-helix domain-containing protein n=1 Tax=Caenimonas sedimenti TaxID=2596921 RepID=A0A562ZGP9_9BURK|nr:helix-turn-helix domain-containing protein [Caenimonas sedimenti]TWO66977.1 helix-turn-helix domain-containing protein [Caenimonas sedimenti]
MSEADEAVPGGETAGSMLRRAREAAGLHVASLAVSLKVPVRKLEALEEDRHDLLPDAVFVRALASSVCRTLKIDPQPILERLPQTSKPRLAHSQDGINTPFRSSGEGPKSGLREHLGKPVVLTVGALLLAAVAVVLLPVAQREADPAGASRGEPVMPPGTPATVTAAPAEPRVAEPAAKPAAVAAPAVLPKPAASALAAAPVAKAASAAAVAAPAPAVVAARPASAAPAPAAAAPAAPAAPAAAAATLPAAAPATAAASAAKASGIVVFRTRASSWIQVTDARGNQVLRKLMEPGETAGATGPLPLTVTVGSAEATEVEVRGKPFNLGPVSRDNVARFEVK